MRIAAIIVAFIAATFGSLLPLSCHALEEQEVLSQLLGNFNYLVETQVRCAGTDADDDFICDRYDPGQRKIRGTWDSHIIPALFRKTYPMRFVDSNLFVTTQTLLPLLAIRFNDAQNETRRRVVVNRAIAAISVYQRNDGFAFWPQIGPSQENNLNRIGPLNLSPILLGTQLEIIWATEDFLHIDLFPQRIHWMQDNIDLGNEESGFDALFNVPNDADDTALAIASNYLFLRENPIPGEVDKYIDMSRNFARYVDTWDARKNRRVKDYISECGGRINARTSPADRQALFLDKDFVRQCSLDDPREAWRYDAYDSGYSGAFLTWLYDETRPVYDDPANGVSLTGQNSVDCNANANVAYSLALTGVRNEPATRAAYISSCNAIANSIISASGEIRVMENPRSEGEQGVAVWKSCGLFFPAHMSFPYMVSRAVGDAGACQDLEAGDQQRFDRAVRVLVSEVIAEQDDVSDNKRKGAWHEPIDSANALATALGGVSLLNFGKAYDDLLIDDGQGLRSRVEAAIEYVLDESDTGMSVEFGKTVSLPEGTYFGGGTVDEIAYWRSQAFSTAVSLELMSKYLVRYSNLPVDGQVLLLGNGPKRAPQQPGDISTSHDFDELRPLSPAAWSRHKVVPKAAIRSGFRGEELLVSMRYSVGDHLQVNFQEEGEAVARYAFKADAWVSYLSETGNVDNFGFDLKFRGISTDTNLIFRDDVAHFPITYVEEYGVRRESIHWRYGYLSAPILSLGANSRLNIDGSARLIGIENLESRDNGPRTNRRSVNLANFSAGFTYFHDLFSASAWVESAVGYSKDSTEREYFSLKNYGLGFSAALQMRKRHSLSFRAVRRVDGADGDLFDDDQAFFQYAYQWY